MENIHLATEEVTDFYITAIRGGFPFESIDDLNSRTRNVVIQVLQLNLSEDLLQETLKLIAHANDRYRRNHKSLNSET